MEVIDAEIGMFGPDRPCRHWGWLSREEPGPGHLFSPCPGIPEPERGQDMERTSLRPSVMCRNSYPYSLRVALGINDVDIPISVISEYPGIQEVKTWVLSGAPPILLNEKGIGILSLRVLVEVMKVTVAGRGIQIEVVLFDVFTMISLFPGKAKGTFFQDRVTAVPER